MRKWLIPLTALATLLAMTAGCLPIGSTADPTRQSDYPGRATAAQGKPIVATIEQIKPNESAVKAGAGEARKAAETAVPFLSNLIEPLDNMPLIMAIIQGARVAEVFFDKVSKAQVTRARIEIPTDRGTPASMVVTPESITVTWPDGSTAVTAPEAVPASLDQPFSVPAMLRSDR